MKTIAAIFLLCAFAAGPAFAASPPETCALLKAVRDLKTNVAPVTEKTPVVASTKGAHGELDWVRIVLQQGTGLADMKLTDVEVADLRAQMSRAGPEVFKPDCAWTSDATAFDKSRLSAGVTYSYSAPLFSGNHEVALVAYSRVGFIGWVCAMRKDKTGWTVSGNCQMTFLS